MRLYLSLFPLLLLTVFAVDRVATVMLGVYPTSADLWGVWIEARPLARPASASLSMISDSLQTQIAVIIAGMALVALFSRNRFFAVIANHLALAYVAASMRGEYFMPTHGGTAFVDFSALQITALVTGLVFCLCGHYAILMGVRNSSVMASCENG